MTDTSSNGARKPRHTVRRAGRPQPGAIYLPAAGPGPRRWDRPAPKPAAETAAGPMLDTLTPLTIEQEGALVRAFGRGRLA